MQEVDVRGAIPAGAGALPWWTRPSALHLLFVMPMLLLVFWAGDSDLTGLALRSRSYLSAPYVFLCFGLVLVSALGAWLGENLQPRTVLQCPDEQLVRAANGLGVVVLATYFFWYRSLLLDPAMLLAVLTGAVQPEREEIGRVVGVTSLVNLAPLFFSLAGYLVFVRKVRQATLLALSVVLLLFTFLRAYVWAERLAVPEALIPLALALLLGLPAPTPKQAVRRLLYRLGPYAALPGVFLFFALAEYFRSWPYYQDRLAFWDFALGRFVSYYFTALNNGAGMLATTDWPTGKFEHVLTWLYTFPMDIGARFAQVVGATSETTDNFFLRRYADPEFNSPSSFAAVVVDLGVAGGILFFALAMFAGGLLYARYRRGGLGAVMLYPSVLLAIFESFRYCYWGTSRFFVWVLGAVIVLAVLWACNAFSPPRLVRHADHRPAA
jgi:hypothetical protein